MEKIDELIERVAYFVAIIAFIYDIIIIGLIAKKVSEEENKDV